MSSTSNPHAAKWDKRYRSGHKAWSEGPNQTVVEQVSGLAPGRALDLACGQGRNAIWLAQQGWRVTAVDFSPAALAAARERALREGVEVEWVEADVSRFEPELGAFDLVLICFLHTDAEERERWIRRAADATAPAGTLIYVGHHPENAVRGHGGPKDPSVLQTAAQVLAQLPGFEADLATMVERGTSAEVGHGAPDRTAVALDAVLRAFKRCDA